MPEQNTKNPSKGWTEKLHNLFAPKNAIENNVQQDQNLPNPDNRREGETFEQWGTRICGVVSGSITALPPYLQKVYNYIYNEQARNVELQEAARVNTQEEISRKNAEINDINTKINQATNKIENYNTSIDELKNEQEKIRGGREEVNKKQRMRLIIGLIIIIPLTFYLFLFYSSTFYSAFFRDPTAITNVMNAMFDSNGISNAYKDGLAELGFVLTAPIIFLGLGFVIHVFSVQEGKMKYLKMFGILLVTVMFDSILAYKIGDQLHTLGIITGQYPIGQVYTLSMALGDINTWAVIFCGFIVYIIWGLVFDMIMSAYDKLDLNKIRLENIKKEINHFKQLIETETNNIANLNQQKTNTQNKINSLMGKLGHQVFIDYSIIRTEMNNFFAGWIKQMTVLSIEQIKQDEASQIYQNEMTMLLPENKQ